jgi:hypothetical protein
VRCVLYWVGFAIVILHQRLFLVYFLHVLECRLLRHWRGTCGLACAERVLPFHGAVIDSVTKTSAASFRMFELVHLMSAAGEMEIPSARLRLGRRLLHGIVPSSHFRERLLMS